MNVGVNKSMAPPIPPAKTGQKKEVKLNAMPWFHGKVCISYGTQFLIHKYPNGLYKNDRNVTYETLSYFFRNFP